jgi:hypothetical protein
MNSGTQAHSSRYVGRQPDVVSSQTKNPSRIVTHDACYTFFLVRSDCDEDSAADSHRSEEDSVEEHQSSQLGAVLCSSTGSVHASPAQPPRSRKEITRIDTDIHLVNATKPQNIDARWGRATRRKKDPQFRWYSTIAGLMDQLTLPT